METPVWDSGYVKVDSEKVKIDKEMLDRHPVNNTPPVLLLTRK